MMPLTVKIETENTQPAFRKSRTGDGINIPNSSFFMFTGCIHKFRPFRCYRLLHIIACKTSKLKFSVAVEFFSCALLKEY
jgi:hypothetical protein